MVFRRDRATAVGDGAMEPWGLEPPERIGAGMFMSMTCPYCDAAVPREQAGEETQTCPGCARGVRLPPAELGRGAMILGYRIEEIVGAGAMGHVFKARQEAMDRVVALKILSTDMTGNPAVVKRFFREVRTMAKLDHPNIVPAFDAGAMGRFHYLAMAFVDGVDLSALLRREGPMEESFVLRVLARMSDALGYAWRKYRLLHRDIKPANIMIDQDGNIRLLDMGIAISLRDDQFSHGAITQQATIVGTPFYISPEQGQSKRSVDFRADIYSLGATAYHCLSGHPPFDGENAVAIVARHLADPLPPLEESAPKVSYACRRLIERMMAKLPQNRHSSWEALGAEINNLLESGRIEHAAIAARHGLGTDGAVTRRKRLSTTDVKTRILIIDDDRQSLALTRSSEFRDYVFTWAATQPKALRLMDSFRPDIVLLNISSRRYEGLPLLDSIRGDQRHDFVRMIVTSLVGSEDVRVNAYHHGADDFLVKPFSPEELLLKIRVWDRFTRIQEISQLTNEFLDLVPDEETSPFPFVAQTVAKARELPEVVANGDLQELLASLEVTAEDFVKRYHLLVDYIECRSETYPFKPEPVTIQALLDPLLGKFAGIAWHRNLAFELPSQSDTTTVWADRDSLSRILRWVVTNALDYAESLVRVDFGPHDDKIYVVDVLDDGAGFAPESLPLVFKGFQRGHGLLAHSGMGLHLSLSRELLVMQGGDIRVRDPGPQSTTVRIELPIAR